MDRTEIFEAQRARLLGIATRVLDDHAEAGDATHQQARDAMKGRWRHPRKSLGWYRDMKKAFSELPEG
jgi:hypothetical protein